MKYLKYVLIVFILVTLIGCDQVTKEIAKDKLSGFGTVGYLNNLIKLQYAENPGAVLSLGSNLPSVIKIWLLSIIPAIVLIFMLVYVFSNKYLSLNAIIAISLMAGGGISNLIDRFTNGFVVDFMIINLGTYSTGIFNFADVAITCGVCLVIYLYLFSKFHIVGEIAE
jgi:signal peptidase II